MISAISPVSRFLPTIAFGPGPADQVRAARRGGVGTGIVVTGGHLPGVA